MEPPLKRWRRSPSSERFSPVPHSPTPWIDTLGMTQYENKEQRLHDEIVAYVKYCEPTDQEATARKLVIDHIAGVIARRFGSCKVELFGSVAQNLCLPDSDIDLVVLSSKIQRSDNLVKTLRQLRGELLRTKVSQTVEVVSRARVPIVKMVTVKSLGCFNVDVSFNNKDGTLVLSLVKRYIEAMPALRPLLLVLKTFLAHRDFNDAAHAGLGSFALTNMVISFLQLNPGKRPQQVLEKPMENESLGRLLLDFFYYYGYTFPYETHYICVAKQKLGLKEDKGWFRSALPEHLSIESLIDPERDIGSGVTKIKKIRAAFGEAFTTLNDFPFSTTTTSANILGSVLGLPKKVWDFKTHSSVILVC
ncbi:Nucleotidyltransferase [Neolentinus lepideus HHB14362 ss-1]|uniref:polynucleotide adenylyltransferase n=1 Tax=Neolentinus lepideus HHB14362 ss-1 TaxID=1314782 RepID=A0A165U4E0_9AGAM|nr:Nucleotidyltransferase [Neolentinus lepideus HHB14362 ss-1]